MKKQIFVGALVGTLINSASAQENILTGDTRLACETILCLSTGSRPDECSPAISRYYGIKKKKMSDTIRARLDFLKQCPVANQTPQMQSLVSAISSGAGRCDAFSLNETLVLWMGDSENRTAYISNQMPNYCTALNGHEYTDYSNSSLPKYVGTPERGGYWVEARNYNSALADYNAHLKGN